MQNQLRIQYAPVHPGTDATDIIFSNEEPDLCALFKPGQTHANGKRFFFVTDATVATLPPVIPFVEQFDDGICKSDNLLIISPGEPYKTIESALEIIKSAVDAGFTRNDTFVAIGGGVICDLTGFAASLFKRGASCIFVPTTLLCMVDAAIGGKTGCDFNNYKNMIGSFFPATSIYLFPKFINSLSDAHYRSGLAEALKTALLYDADMYALFKNESAKVLSRDYSTISSIICTCTKLKAHVVETDFTERGERMYLNYGHTFAHALESLAGFGNITHGDAVAWGIGRAVTLSNNLRLCNIAYRDDILSTLDAYGWETAPVPMAVTGGAAGKRLLAIMHSDKKNISSSVRVVLQKGLTETLVQEVSDDDILSALR